MEVSKNTEQKEEGWSHRGFEFDTQLFKNGMSNLL